MAEKKYTGPAGEDRKGKKTYSLVMVIPHASRHFPIIRKMMKSIHSEFSSGDLADMRIDGWVIKDRVGIILVFRKKAPLRGLIEGLDLLIRDLNIRVYEMDDIMPIHQKAIMDTFATSPPDVGYRGPNDLDKALQEIDGVFLEHHKNREQWYSERIPVGVKTLL